MTDRIVLIGLGGIGSQLLAPLVRYLAHRPGPRPLLVLVDGDAYEPGNRSRQDFPDDALGTNKAVALAQVVRGSGLAIGTVSEYVGPDNVGLIVREDDIVLLAVDNHPTRALVDRHIAELSDVTLISGGNDETDGNVQLVRRRDGYSVDGHLTEIHPEIGRAVESEVMPGNGCAAQMAERPQLVVTNLMVASAMLNCLWAVIEQGSIPYSEVYLDVVHNAARSRWELKQLSQTRSTNPFRPGSGILPPFLAGRERETAIFEARVARTREGQPQHTALLGEWAIGKTTLQMHWRRLRQQAGDAVVLSMAYPQSSDEFLAGLVNAIDAELATDGPRNLDVELGLDIGIAAARIRRPSRDPERELRAALRRLVEHQAHEGRSVVVLLDDVDLLPMTGDVLLRLRACALELYAADLPLAFLVAASSGLFDAVRSAHEPLVRFFEPLYLGPLEPGDAARAIIEPVEETMVQFDPEVVAEIVDLAGGRPYYLQKLGYFAFDAAIDGRVTRAEFAVAFERAFASVSQEIFAARWAGMSPIDRQVVAVIARSTEPRPSGAIEAEAQTLGVRPGAARQALRRLAARGHINRLASGHRGRYAVRDRLFQRYLELQTCEL